MSKAYEMFESGMHYQDIAEVFEAENAKLHQQLADVTASMGRVEERCAELREVVKGLISRYKDEIRDYWEGQEPPLCDLCSMEGQCRVLPRHGRCPFYDHLRELGIEVNG